MQITKTETDYAIVKKVSFVPQHNAWNDCRWVVYAISRKYGDVCFENNPMFAGAALELNIEQSEKELASCKVGDIVEYKITHYKTYTLDGKAFGKAHSLILNLTKIANREAKLRSVLCKTH